MRREALQRLWPVGTRPLRWQIEVEGSSYGRLNLCLPSMIVLMPRILGPWKKMYGKVRDSIDSDICVQQHGEC